MAKAKTSGGTTAKKAAPTSNKRIQCWATDPSDALPLRQVAAPVLPGAVLSIHINTAKLNTAKPPAPASYPTGTVEFRYWVAAEALRRAADFWSSVGCKKWQAAVGDNLEADLDVGDVPNSYYARENYPNWNMKAGLSFYHFTASSAAHPGQLKTIYFGESPDILAHELGHAVLDSLRPQLYEMNTAEYAAFHEAFADISAVLTALQLVEVREAVVAETQGEVWLNSSVARLAEEVGKGLQQKYPQSSDPDCLRNLSTRWVYRDPTQLNNSGPNTELTSEAHNFSRVFSGAFLNALGRMAAVIAGKKPVTAEHVRKASYDSGLLLVEAVRKAPLRTRFFQAVAEQLVIAAESDSEHGSAYVKALTTAMVRYGLLASPVPPPAGHTLRSFAHAVAFAAIGTNNEGVALPENIVPAQVELNNTLFGLPLPLLAQGPALDEDTEHRPMGVMTALSGTSKREQEVQHFVENLARQGRIEARTPGANSETFLDIIQSSQPATHRLEESEDGKRFVLRRMRIACGCC